MADIAVALTKEVPFQGRAEQYTNVYTFNVDFFSGGVESDEIVIDRLLALERTVHTNVVRFVEARSYSIGGLQAENVMRAIRDFPTGTIGEAPNHSNAMYRECAILVQFALPRSAILRRKRMGRKWLHTGGLPAFGTGLGDPQVNGSAALPAAFGTAFLDNYATPLLSGWPEGWEFGSGGDPFSEPTIHPYVEHRQFHR